jgi:hypothetical protein
MKFMSKSSAQLQVETIEWAEAVIEEERHTSGTHEPEMVEKAKKLLSEHKSPKAEK